MKHGEKVTSIAGALTSLATLACCLPMGFAAATVTASLSTVVATYQPWLLGLSVILVLVGGIQLRGAQRTCETRPHASLIVFGPSVLVVVLVVLFPQIIAGMLADWLP